MKTRLFLTGLALAMLPAASYGDVIFYTIDADHSSLSVTGTYNGFPLDPQIFPLGGLTSYQGTITADRNLATDSLRIVGASVVAAPNTSVSLGKVIPLPGFAPNSFGNYQIFAHNGPGLITVGDYEGILTDLALGITAPATTDPQSAGISGIQVSILSGDLVSQFLNPGVGSPTELQLEATAPSAGAGSVADNGGTEMLTIPLDFSMEFTAEGKPLDLQFTGQIVATTSWPVTQATPAPEPSSLLLSVGFFSLVFGRRRRPRGDQHP